MYSREGRGRGRGSGNWRQGRDDYSRRHERSDNQDRFQDDNYGSQYSGSSRDVYDSYDNKRQRVTDTKGYSQQQYGYNRDDEPGSSQRPQKERPPPYLTGKEIENREEFSHGWNRADECDSRQSGHEDYFRKRVGNVWDDFNYQDSSVHPRIDNSKKVSVWEDDWSGQKLTQQPWIENPNEVSVWEDDRSRQNHSRMQSVTNEEQYTHRFGNHCMKRFASDDESPYSINNRFERNTEHSFGQKYEGMLSSPYKKRLLQSDNNYLTPYRNVQDASIQPWSDNRDMEFSRSNYDSHDQQPSQVRNARSEEQNLSRPEDNYRHQSNFDDASHYSTDMLNEGDSEYQSKHKFQGLLSSSLKKKLLQIDHPAIAKNLLKSTRNDLSSQKHDTSKGRTKKLNKELLNFRLNRGKKKKSTKGLLKVFVMGIPLTVFPNEISKQLVSRGYKVKLVRKETKLKLFMVQLFKKGNNAKAVYKITNLCGHDCVFMEPSVFFIRRRNKEDQAIENSASTPLTPADENVKHDSVELASCEQQNDTELLKMDSPKSSDQSSMEEIPENKEKEPVNTNCTRPACLFIQNLPLDYNCRIAKDELIEMGFKVKFVCKNKKLDVHIVSFAETDNIMDMFAVTNLGGHEIKVVEPKLICNKKKFKQQVLPGSLPSEYVQPPGLWYRDRNRANQKQGGLSKAQKAERRMQRRTSVPIELPPQKIRDIRQFLDSIGTEAPPTISQIRKSNESSTGDVHDKYKHVGDSEFKRRFLTSISGSIDQKIKNTINQTHLSYKEDKTLNVKYKNELLGKKKDPEYCKMFESRKKLPAFSKESDVIEALDKNQVILISGETGCGKTTQVPQFILDHEINSDRGSLCHIVCTQPRRISAISVAERVAQERDEKIGVSVGYQIRLEHVTPRKTGSIVFCTTGILLQMLQGDPVLKAVSHVILDEIHERDTLSDFSITILKDLIKMRKDLKIILMSATLNAEQFSKYFDNCPTVHIPGFTFPVKEFYLEDVLELTGVIYDKKALRKPFRSNKGVKSKYITEFLEPYIRSMRKKHKYSEQIFEYLLSPYAEEVNLDLIVQLVHYISNNEGPGAILVFLPGWDKISALTAKMLERNLFPDSKYVIIPLHSMLGTVAQKTIFDKPPQGKRKIVVATNIAETSITIDDVVYVINCGKIKLKNFDVENNVTTLKEEWVSLANARQRKGRAGRVQDGVCYHMYCHPKELTLESFQLPEMLRTRLEEVILQMKVLQLGKAEPFLKKVMDPPSEKTIHLSIDLLKNMNALDSDEHLTPLGYHLAHLPVDPQAGKMIMFAALFGCVDPITSIAASLSFKDAFFVPLGKEKEVKQAKLKLADGTKSDHILMANVMSEWREAMANGQARSFTSSNFLSYNTLVLLRDMKKQFVDHLYEMKFVDDRNIEAQQSNANSNNHALLRSIICAGLYPNIAVVKNKKKRPGFSVFTALDGRISIHIKSINNGIDMIEGGFLAYYLKIKSTGINLHDTSMIFPMSLIFFCQSFTVEHCPPNKRMIKLNNNICFICDPEVACLIQELRAWLDWLLEYKIAHPGTIDWSNSTDETLILKAIIILLTAESQLYLQEYSDNSDDEYNQDNYMDD